ncbi:DUF4386 domain-containing protein [Thiomicrorhabdus cannonii]|uniref:DUF4386 domain-containing protein n=1 Tax=Thiomicrorhabdus cannonii TaxID=2748011 RepID=UPI0015BE6DE6|nr:DUF4386 domain-containing protein [Thiomicrorhabdus cannonii]
MNVNPEIPSRLYARVAGLLYLLIIVCGIGSEVFIRSHLIVSGDAAMTASNILAEPSLFRLGFAADVVMLLCDVAIAVLFYILFKPVSATLSLMAAMFRLMQAAILGVNLLNYYAASLILNAGGTLGGFDDAHLNQLASLFLQLHSHGYDLGLFFFGISCLILGYLVVRSGCFPPLLGYGLAAAGLVYLTGSLVRFVQPEWTDMIAPLYVVPLLAELAFCLYLLVIGVRKEGM